jgi:hypothetical protein
MVTKGFNALGLKAWLNKLHCLTTNFETASYYDGVALPAKPSGNENGELPRNFSLPASALVTWTKPAAIKILHFTPDTMPPDVV